VLNGAEWDLFRLGLSTLRDDVEMSDDDEEPGTTSIAVFDNQRKPERLALLAQVARCLHDEAEQAARTGTPISLEVGRIERRDEGWVGWDGI
jgi:hypothetical protein